MRNLKVPSIATELNILFPAELLRRTARECGATTRNRCIDIVPFFWTLLLAPTVGAIHTLAAFQRVFQLMAGIQLVPSSYLERFNERLVTFLFRCLQHAVNEQDTITAYPHLLRHFDDVLAIDSSLVALAEALAATFPGTRSNCPSALKVNAVYSVTRGTLHGLEVAAGSKAEIKFLRPGSDYAGTLLLMDLGYFSWAVFERIDHFKGSFISRLKANANPEIVAEHSHGAGRRRPLVGRKLRPAIKGLKRDTLDVTVRVRFQRNIRKRRGSKRPRTNAVTKLLRVVGTTNNETGRWHLYVTNVEPDVMTPDQVSAAYTARWIVELAFLELKKRHGLHLRRFKREAVVKTIVLASLLRMMTCRAALDVIRRRLGASRQAAPGSVAGIRNRVIVQATPALRFAAVFASYSPFLLPWVLSKAGFRWRAHHVEMLLTMAAIDPNRSRDSLPRRLADA